MRKSLFAGLSILEAGESLSEENGAFIGRDREIIDRLLEVGAKTHRHTGLAGLSNPSVAASAGIHASAGLIGADLGLSIGYTLEDSAGGETMLSPIAVVSTAPAMDGPDQAPKAEVSHASGVLPVNTYFYCVTFLDGEGGETLAGPAVSAERQPGYEFGQVLLSGLEAGMAAAGAAGWRLYRAIGGGTFDLLASGGAGEDTFADLGVDSPNCTIHPPLESTTTGFSTLLVTLPSGGLQTAEFINLYGSVTGDFSGGSLLGQYPVSSAGQQVAFRKFETDAASPPPVNLSVGGAHQIDPDTDILDWHWKRPVASSAALGSGGQGDVRLATKTGRLYAVLAASASAAPGWVEIASAGTGGSPGGEGRSSGYRYKWSTNTEASDPGSGKLRADSATFGSIAFLLLSETDADGNGMAVPISAWDDSTSTIRGTVEIRKVGSPTVFRLFNIAGGRTDNGAWDALPVTPVASFGTLNDGDEVMINVTRTGDKGDTGSTGATGATGGTGPEGPAGLPVVMAAGNPGSSTGTKSVSATEIEGTNTGAIGAAGSLDGVTLKAGDWFFHFNGSKNDGVWEVVNAGGVGVKWQAKRPNGISTSASVERTAFLVKGGNTFKGRTYMIATTGITLGTTELTFTWMQSRDWGLVTSLPTASAVVGDRCTYKAEASEGVYWQLIYDGEGSFPWKCIGGDPLFKQVETDEATTSATYTALATAGPTVKVPLAGDYFVEVSCRMWSGTTAYGYMSYKVNGAGAADADSVGDLGGVVANGVSGVRKKRKNGLEANSELVAQYRSQTGGSGINFKNRWMSVMPIRVG